MPPPPFSRFRRALVVFNPVAGTQRQRLQVVLNGLASLECGHELLRTSQRGDAEQAGRTAYAKGFDLIIAAGGDGTINEIVNGLSAAETKVPLAFLPLGTANVLAAEIGLKATPPAVLAMIAQGRRRTIRLGLAGGRHFVLMASAGLDAAVVRGVDLGLKRRTGQLAYAIEALRQAFSYPFPELIATIDGTPHAGRMVVACRARCYGGGFQVALGADLTDEWLQVVILKKGGRAALLRYGAALVTGRLQTLPDVAVVPARSLTLDGPLGAPLQADGDLAGALPIHIAVSDRTIELVVP
ncbi:MAG: diacylglycerol kinase family lipid kinase [Alphaproteobacteria bacterium]|nr:diacylglycerol kinase family lipid kinase [Alphaproteobacteria bacterium]